MCGIVAAFAYAHGAPAIDAARLLAARDCMASRGPDGKGEWFGEDGRAALGHRRLAIIDLSEAGAQPMTAGHATIVLNGEIYNYKELRRGLEAKGHRFRSQSDTEVILRLYLEKGPDCVRDLRGMFAFALWDGRQRGLLLARDPLGIKPLYVADDGRTLWAASQVRALLAAGVSREADSAGHLGFWLQGYVPDPFTFFRSIRAVEAGTWLWRDAESAKSEKYYDLKSRMIAAELGAAVPIESRSEILRDVISDSARAHLVADVPVGIFLSSGTDSTSIATVASRAGAKMAALTIGAQEFRNTRNDETPLAHGIATELGLKHSVRWLNAASLYDWLGDLISAMDQPSIDGANTFFVSATAKELGFKVALSGLGGDELFAGYPSFRQSALLRWLGAPFSGAFGRAARRLLARPISKITSPKYASLLEYGGSYESAYFLRRALFLPWELQPRLDSAPFREAYERIENAVIHRQGTKGIRSRRLKVSFLEMTRYMCNQLLRDSDWAGMASSIEIRTPFADATLIDALLPMLASPSPPHKRDVLNAIDPPLKSALSGRPKTGFGLPIREWLLEREGISDRSNRGWGRLVYRMWCTQNLVEPILDVEPKRRKRLRTAQPQTVLIHQLGSIGDTVVALPAYHLIARAFPDAKRVVLTNLPRTQEVLTFSVVEPTGLVSEAIDYPVAARAPGELKDLIAQIRAMKPDLVVHLVGPRGLASAYRDYLFYRTCGIPRVVGLPKSLALQRWEKDSGVELWESEAHRQSRCLSMLGDPNLDDARSWDLHLTASERRAAQSALAPLAAAPFIALCPGAKIRAKDWGEANWREWALSMGRLLPGVPVVIIGSAEERARAEAIGKAIKAPIVNLCGKLSPRETAAVLERARCFVGHDGGPMHLAAASGTPCVALFGSYNRPGVWHPCGHGHIILHKKTLGLITPDEVAQATVRLFNRNARVAFDSAPEPERQRAVAL